MFEKFTWRSLTNVLAVALAWGSVVGVAPQAEAADVFIRGMNVPSGLPTSEIAEIAELGPRLIRYQLLNNTANTDSVTQYQAWLESALDELDAALPVYAANGMQVLIDMHTAPGGFASTAGPLPQHSVFANAEHQALLIELWNSIAARYAGNSTVWGYEIMSEPNEGTVAAGLKNWNDLASTIVANIRSIDTTHYIVLQAIYGNPDKVTKLPKLSDSKLVYSFNFYYPFSFTKQGVEGYSYNKKYPTKKVNRAALDKRLTKLKRFKKKVKKPIMVGEFSVVRWAPNGSGAKYLSDLVKVFERAKFSYCYHDWGGAGVWSLTLTNEYGSDAEATSPTDRYLALQKFYQKGR